MAITRRIAWQRDLRRALSWMEQGAAAAGVFVRDHFLALPIGAVVALVWANTEGESYFAFAHALRFAVNDIGMVLFVGLVTQEIVEAVERGGTLYRWRRTLLPVVAAIGGVLGAVGVYLLYVRSQYEFVLMRGWPVAAAEDVAFAYFIAKGIFNSQRRGPVAFLLMVAIVSDALGILGIAIWFPATEGYPAGLALAVAAVALAIVLRAARVRALWPYLVFSGTLSWLACYWAGIQPALALVPIVPFLPHRPRRLDLFADESSDHRPLPGRFEQVFRYPVQIVLLFFGLVNGGVVLAREMPGAWGVLVAALVGRPLGILAAVGLALAMGLRLPERLHWRELIVVSLSASAGFAFALFFATAVVPVGPVLGDLKLGALSTGVSALIAFAAARLLHVGRFVSRPQPVASAGLPRMPRRAAVTIFLGASLLLLTPGTAVAPLAQTSAPARPSLVIPSVAGRDLFEFYCATCHGRDGKGHGPVAAALKAPPPDLTLLARRNGGRFPNQRVEAFVANDGAVLSPAHGTSDMPVWGPIFRGLDPSDTLAKIRVANVVAYIDSMQAR